MRLGLVFGERGLLVLQRDLLIVKILDAGRILLVAAALQLQLGLGLVGRAASLVERRALCFVLLGGTLTCGLGFPLRALGHSQAGVERCAR